MATHNATTKSSQNRSEDRLDLTVLLGLHVSALTRNKKASVAYAMKREAARLALARHSLEKQLVDLLNSSKGVIGFLCNAMSIRKVKAKLVELNQKILDWMSSTAKFYALKFANIIAG